MTRLTEYAQMWGIALVWALAAVGGAWLYIRVAAWIASLL